MNLPPDLVIALFFVWLSVLTFLIVKSYISNVKIMKGNKKESVTAILEEVLKHEEQNKKAISELRQLTDNLKVDGTSHIQKIGLVRFNPFKETGGDQSFILALVDADDNGVVISSLHTRTGTRWYAKNVRHGQGAEYDLSDDERKALKGAQLLSENK
jgi:hypothetical protein